MNARHHTDADARRAIRDDLDDTLVVEAAAGTGKTTELVNRILRVLATGAATMIEIVAVTFTEKAAGELKLRLREALEQERSSTTDDDVRERLEHALATLEEAHVNTIHGFCADLLRERPVEAGVDPLFAVMTEAQSDQLYARAFHAWLQEALRNPPDGLRRALRRSSRFSGFSGVAADGPVDRLRGAGRTLAEWRDYPRPWRRPPFDRSAEVDRLVASLHRFADLTARAASERDNLHVDTDGVRRLSRQIRLEQSFGQRDLDGWEARLVDLTRDRGFSRPRKGSGYKYGADVTRTQVLAARDELFADLQRFRKDADADLAAALQHELAGATTRYGELKAAGGALDFADLLARTRNLIETNEGVRAHLQAKFTRIFVDEFQDTDPVQAEILLLLSSDDPRVRDWEHVTPRLGKLFIVGDPKQAIYGFRGTGVGTYWYVSKLVERRGGRRLQLTTSYRSLPAIQRFVNAAFSAEMTANDQTLQANYVPLEPSRPEDDSQPTIVALPVPTPYASRRPLRSSAKAIDESLPEVIGAFIAWLIDAKNGWQVEEPGPDGSAHRVQAQPRHIAVLFRRFVSFGDDVTRPYIDAMEARSIPHLLVGGKAFHGREEVETIRAALAAIEWPDDELSVFATLKGALFAIDDEHLLQYRHRFGAFHPFRVPKELGGNSGQDLALTGEPTAQLAPIAEALRLLQQLHRERNYRPVADTIGRLLAQTRAHVGFILRPAGEQALANVLHVAELARQYEAGGGISFRGFIDELRRAAESTQSAEAPILEEGSDGVRLMTVHKAKGLEFSIVILADLTCRISRNDASRYLDAPAGLCAMKIGGWAPHELHDHEQEEVARDQAEGVRLAYVAATRARDLLVVPAIGDQMWEGGWFSPLNRALYPAVADRRSATRGPKCPAFKSKDSVLQRPNDETAGPGTVAPGQHTFVGGVSAGVAGSVAEAGYSVVWWDPGALDLGKPVPSGVRREELIVKDVPRDVVADGRGQYDSWRLARENARATGAIPSLVVQTAREWAEAEGEGADTTRDVTKVALPVGPDEVTVVNVGRGVHVSPEPDRDRPVDWPGGASFGILVHALLAQAPLDLPFGATRNVLAGIAAVDARLLGAPDDVVQAALSLVERVLSHDLLKRAAAAATRGVCRRETPVSAVLADGTLIEGVVDLAFEEAGAWIVVDYKTDRELVVTDEHRYRRQIALYASAVARATGQRAQGILARV